MLNKGGFHMSQRLLDYILKKEHYKFRNEFQYECAEECSQKGLNPEQRMADRFKRLSEAEIPHILPDEKIVYMRTVKNIPDIFTQNEWKDIKSNHFIHELGYLSNLSPNYEDTIKHGLLAKSETSNDYGKLAINHIIMLSDRYREEAEKQGKIDIAEVLKRVPKYGATNFREALQFFRIIHFSLWLEGNYHVTVGRFDQYMYPYLKRDMEKGMYTKETALELLEDFFISFNKDNDLYPGVQQGDNGQSMVIGGIDTEGNESFNLLSELCLKASKNLKLIDPKINLRVNKNTPLMVFELASELTKEGLGFPQYSNDDVVIDGLQRCGYDLADARNYTVAACWEFIIPKCGGDVPNIGALSFPKVVDIALHNSLEKTSDFETFMSEVDKALNTECETITSVIKDLWFVPSPFMSVVMDKIKYNNFGIHGTGIATAADSLAAIKKYIFEERTVEPQTMIDAVKKNFDGYNELLIKLRYHSPKMGNNDAYVDDISVRLLDMFSNALAGKTNCKGGIYRAGTGSAMYYLWHATEIGASPDGRRKGEAFGTNFSPSLFARINGPISVIKSFSKHHFKNAINGGPLTLEFHCGVFRDIDGIRKVAMLVKSYIVMGGHQLQLNAVNAVAMKDAQEYPEKYPHLVVRIWGWSAYFTELDREYQNHVIARQEYVV